MFKLQLKIQGTYQVSWTPPSLPLSDGIWWHLMSQVAQSRDPPPIRTLGRVYTGTAGSCVHGLL